MREARHTALRRVPVDERDPPPTRRRRGLRRSPALALVTGILALGLVPSILWRLGPQDHARRPAAPRVDPRYATQGGSVARSRRADVTARAVRESEAAQETCGGLGVQELAARYGVAPSAELVARRYASGYAISLRRQVLKGCLRGLAAG